MKGEKNEFNLLTCGPCKAPTPGRCPDCGAPLGHVKGSGWLNSDQFDSVKAGDFYCTGTCKGDRGQSGLKYFWRRELPHHHGDRSCPNWIWSIFTKQHEQCVCSFGRAFIVEDGGKLFEEQWSPTKRPDYSRRDGIGFDGGEFEEGP
jgi:hypothetical protein